MTNHIKNFTLKNFEGFKIISNFSGTKVSSLDADSINRHYKIRLTGLATGKSLTFDLWTDAEVPVLNTTAQLKEAMFVFLDACLTGYVDYEEHCFEVGYEMNKETKAMHDQCMKYLQKLEKIYEGNIVDLYDEVGMRINAWTEMVAL